MSNKHSKSGSTGEPAATLAAIQSSFSRYIRSPSEVLEIRQKLTLHLLSNAFPTHTNDKSTVPSECHHIDLISPPQNLKPHLIPTEVSSLRKEYLRTLQSHLRAREEYDNLIRRNERVISASSGQSVSLAGEATRKISSAVAPLARERRASKPTSASGQSAPTVSPVCPDLVFLQRHFALVSLRQRQSKLKILHRYLDELTQIHTTEMQTLERETRSLQAPTFQRGPSAQADAAFLAMETKRVDERIAEKVFRLEKAVLEAQGRVRKERELLDNAKQETKDMGDVDEKTKAIALARTRDELIAWMEDELANSGSADERADDDYDGDNDSEISPRKQTSNRKTDNTRAQGDAKEGDQGAQSMLINRQLEMIKSQYESYIKLRRQLLHSVAKDPTCKMVIPTRALPGAAKPATQLTPVQSPYPHPYHTIQTLLPPTHETLAFLQLTTHLSTLLNASHASTLAVLDRLEHESHLLTQYPMPQASESESQSQAAASASASSRRPLSATASTLFSSGTGSGNSIRARTRLFESLAAAHRPSASVTLPPRSATPTTTTPAGDRTAIDEVMTRMRAWTHAFAGSRADMEAFVKAKSAELAQENAGSREALHKLVDLLGDDFDALEADALANTNESKTKTKIGRSRANTRSKSKAVESDLWLDAAAADTTTKTKKKPRGPWRSLKGDVGYDEKVQ